MLYTSQARSGGLTLYSRTGLLQAFTWPEMDLIVKPDSLVKPGAGHLDTHCLILMIHGDSLSYTSKCTVKMFCEGMYTLVMGACAVLQLNRCLNVGAAWGRG